MPVLEPKHAYLAMVAFLDELWERTSQPGELGDLCGMCRHIPGHGSYDPAMWYDWLAWVNRLQTGALIAENSGQRGSLTPDTMNPLDPEQAYLVMYAFIEEYWTRVNRPAELGDLLGLMRYTPGVGTADPSMWRSWLTAFNRAHGREAT